MLNNSCRHESIQRSRKFRTRPGPQHFVGESILRYATAVWEGFVSIVVVGLFRPAFPIPYFASCISHWR